MPSAPRKRRGPGRPRKPKRAHAVTLTLTLPNAAFRRHLQRTAKAAGHKTPSALIIATFPRHTTNPPPSPSPTPDAHRGIHQSIAEDRQRTAASLEALKTRQSGQ